jgi:hypothetical protein
VVAKNGDEHGALGFLYTLIMGVGMTKPTINFEVLHPRIIVAKYEQNPSRGF